MAGEGIVKGLARAAIAASCLLTTACATYIFFTRMIGADGLDLLDVPLLVLFTVLFLWISFSFWTATAGLVECLASRSRARTPRSARPPPSRADLPRTAVLMPVYNEDPWRVFAGLSAMYDSLQPTGLSDRFDFYVLSDTTEPRLWLEEELAWAVATEHLRNRSGVYYRRRRRNVARKSGNVADFCMRWGRRYAYMIVLDADSVMAGESLVEMVRRMEADPRLGILQVPPVPVNRGSFFARLQEFAAGVYGRVFVTGFALWSQTDSNYWGHNAIIRVEPFVKHCGLPVLPGKAPFGGEILSHDFVEAALLRRAGWKVVLADDLGGSYEECPATLIDFAQRDQRWCQGNLQHLKIMFVYGLHPLSRMHMGMGVMSYLSSLLWLLFITLGVLAVVTPDLSGSSAGWVPQQTQTAVGLFVATMLMLFLPKLWGYLVLLADAGRRRACAGPARAAVSMLLETMVSVLTAPIMMAFHVTFIILTMLGKKVLWSAQRREEVETKFSEAFAAHAGHTIAGLVAMLLLSRLAPSLVWWLSPVIGGLILSIPLSIMLSSVALGQWLRTKGILVIVEETETPQVLRLQSAYQIRLDALRRRHCQVDPFLRVLVDPAFNALHIAMLEASGEGDEGEPDPRLWSLERVALYGGPRHMDRDDTLALLNSPAALRWVHISVWRQWSLETLKRIVDPVLLATASG